MLWYGLIDSAEHFPMPEDQPWTPTVGWMLMLFDWPTNRPDRFGDWFARSTGEWEWVKYPDPPFPVVFHENKLKNSDTMVEITQETLPGDIAARLSALEALVLPPSP